MSRLTGILGKASAGGFPLGRTPVSVPARSGAPCPYVPARQHPSDLMTAAARLVVANSASVAAQRTVDAFNRSVLQTQQADRVAPATSTSSQRRVLSGTDSSQVRVGSQPDTVSRSIVQTAVAPRQSAGTAMTAGRSQPQTTDQPAVRPPATADQSPVRKAECR